jgi:glycosyltransferase involved in cell wall biosynthesis
VIVPTRNEAATIADTLARLREPEVLEVLVVDGESEDATVDLARPLADRVIGASPGRARQMNTGAEIARGEVLLFLHADTKPPRGFAAAIVEACGDAIGGRFDVELDAPGLAYHVIATAINVRSTTESESSCQLGLVTLVAPSGSCSTTGSRMPETTGVRHTTSKRPGAVSVSARYAGRAS